MDVLSAVMDAHRARGADLLRCEMRGAWALRVEDDPPVAVVVVLSGSASLSASPRPRRPQLVSAGDIVIVKGRAPYTLGDTASTAPTIVIEPGNTCRSLTGERLDVSMGLGTRTWGNAGSGPPDTVFLTASWRLASQVSGRLLDRLPEVAVVHGGTGLSSLIEMLAHEVQRDLPGQDVVLDRLVDLVLIAALRSWFDDSDTATPSWWAARSDPVVGQALSLLHGQPGAPWTLETLAGRLSVSRATLSRRFRLVVGQPPMTYLTQWRLARAADLLRGSELTVEQVAHEVGYANAFAFSTAFKRAHDLAPRDFRRARAG